MAAPTVKSPLTEERFDIASRVAVLHEQSATAPLAARDTAWRWFEQLGEETRRDRSRGGGEEPPARDHGAR